MAGTYEEDFVYREIYNLKGKNLKIFEFGCGQNQFIDKIIKLGHDVTAIDLYERTIETKEIRKFNFIKGDFDILSFEPNQYDCIYALSSVEHIGLEDKILEWDDSESKLDRIISKFNYILKLNGTLLLTLPFGSYEHWYVDNQGKSTKKIHRDGVCKSVWGAKVYDINDITNIQKYGFVLERKEFYLKPDKSSNYFDKNAWIIANYNECYNSREPAGAVVCLKFIKKSP